MKKMSSNLRSTLDVIDGKVTHLVSRVLPVAAFFLLVGWVFYIAGSIKGAPWPDQVLPWKMLGGTFMYVSICLQVMISIPYAVPVSRVAWVRVLTIIASPAIALFGTFLYRTAFDMWPPIWVDYIVIVVSALVSLYRQVRIKRI